jgi:hypothetical protein
MWITEARVSSHCFRKDNRRKYCQLIEKMSLSRSVYLLRGDDEGYLMLGECNQVKLCIDRLLHSISEIIRSLYIVNIHNIFANRFFLYK